MEVYIEQVIIDNFCIDFILLLATIKTLKKRKSYIRLIFSSMLGVILTVIYPLLSLNALLQIAYKILTATSMLLVLFYKETFKIFFKGGVIFLTYTFLFGGILVALKNAYSLEFIKKGKFVIAYDFPVGIVLLLAFLLYKIFVKVFISIKNERGRYPFCYQVELVLGEEKLKCVGFLDSGNRLFDSDGEPIYIVNKDIIYKLFKNDFTLILKKGKYHEFNTVSGKNKMFTVKIDKIVIYNGKEKNIIENGVVGISPTKMSGQDILLHSSILSLKGE